MDYVNGTITDNIDVVVHGDDYNQEQINLYYGPAAKRGIYESVGYTPGISTTNLIKRIVERFGQK